MTKENQRAIEELRKKYSSDEDALEEIARAVIDIDYYEKKGQQEKATAHLNNLEAFLHDWY